MLIAHPTDNKLGELCYFLLRKSGIFISKREFLKHLYTNENYASLLSVTETLSYFGVETLCVRTDIRFLQENKEPALLYLRSAESSEFVVWIDFPDSGRIRFKDENLRTHTQPLAEFLARWDGVALFPLSPDKPFLPDPSSLLGKALAGCLGLLLGWIVYRSLTVSPLYFTFLCLKIAGLSITVLLLRHALGKTSRIEHKLCTFHRHVDCDAVLSSPAAKIGQLASMSDIGFVYFTGGIAVLLTGLLTAEKEAYLALLCILSYFSFIYTLFSLFYQRIVVKKWCPLCLGVLVIIWVECALGWAARVVSDLPPVACITAALFIFILISLTWKFVYALLKEKLRLENTEYAYLKMKKDTAVFNSLLEPLPVNESVPAFSCPLVCGNEASSVLLTIVLSFSCYPCRNLFLKVKSQLARENNTIKCRFVFLPKSESDRLQTGLVTNIYRSEGEEAFLTALSESFGKTLTAGEAGEEEEKRFRIAEEYQAWVKQRKIAYTPLLLWGHKKIPLWYDWEEIVYFLN